jgi:hypothetical protein
MRTHFTYIALISLIIACSPPEQQTAATTSDKDSTKTIEEKESFSSVQEVEQAHAKEVFLSHEAIAFDIRLSFGGKERLNGRMTLATNSSRGVIDYSNGDRLIFNKDKVFHNPDMERASSARFAAYTWSYFFLFPYKLSDPGTQWSAKETQSLNDKSYDYQMLTFDAGTGDAPDDWYKMYSDSESKLIEVAAYIVTAGGTVEEAEIDPHAIKYERYSDISGVPISTAWTFWAWREEGGLTKQLGEASISNIEFIKPNAELFTPGEGYLEK